MANTITSTAKEYFLAAFLTDDVRVLLLDSSYTYSSAHDFLDDVPAGARVAVSGALASKSVTSGIFDAADITFTALTGDPITQGYYYNHTGVEATSRLLAYFDQAEGITLTPDGRDITFEHGNGANKIFAIEDN